VENAGDAALREHCATVIVRRSIASACPASGQKTSSHGVPASSEALIVGDHSMSRPVASLRFQRSMMRAALSAFSLTAPVKPSVLTPMAPVSRLQKSIQLRRHRRTNLPSRLALLFWGGAIKGVIVMDDFPSPTFIGSAALLALLLLGPALDGAGLAEAAAVSVLMAAWAAASEKRSSCLVASLRRPGGNMTGVTVLTTELTGKRLDLLHEIASSVTTVPYITDPRARNSEDETKEFLAAARVLGHKPLSWRRATRLRSM
jgi:hypothetical protein